MLEAESLRKMWEAVGFPSGIFLPVLGNAVTASIIIKFRAISDSQAPKSGLS